MNGVISRLSPYGFQVEGNKDWINVSKFEKDIDLKNFAKGDNVSYEQNKKGYVTKLQKSTGAAFAAAVASLPDTDEPSALADLQPAHSNSAASLTDKDLRITRLSALSTAFGAPYERLASAEGVSLEDAASAALLLAERLTQYALNGTVAVPEEANV